MACFTEMSPSIAGCRGLVALLILWLGVTGPLPAAPGILVIAHDKVLAEALDRAALARIYRRWQRIDEAGRPLVPVNLPATTPLRRAFSQVLFGQPPEAMADFWDEQYFQGVSPPTVQTSPAALLRFVQRTPGALGYLPDCLDPRGVVVAMRLAWPSGVNPAGVCAEPPSCREEDAQGNQCFR